MKLPQGYEGAYEKALKKAGVPTKSSKLNMLADLDDEDEDSNYGEPPIVFALMGGYTTSDDEGEFPNLHCSAAYRAGRTKAARQSPKTMAADLAKEETHELDPEAIASLNGWSTKVSRRRSRGQKSQTLSSIQTEADLDRHLAQNPRLQKISANMINRASRELPPALICGPGEILCLVDSGASMNAAWIEKHFPGFLQLLRSTDSNRYSATTAGGGVLTDKGSCSVSGSIDGLPSKINFRDMEVEMPILSVRKMVKNHHRVQFQDKGGYIENIKTGRRISFHEHAGVYYLKLKVDDMDLIVKDNESGFPRPGR